MGSKKWTSTIDGIDVDFYIDELQPSHTTPLVWRCYWEVNGTSRLEPIFLATEPTVAEMEAYYKS